MSLHIVEEVDQLCQLYNATKVDEEKRKLRDILNEKRKQISTMCTKLNSTISKLDALLDPPSASPNLYSGHNVYNVYNI